MELVVRHFRELSTEELWEIYCLRVSVFVVEQACPYQEVDRWDREAYHVFLREGDQILAYLRVLPAGTVFDSPSIGRVLSTVRRQGLGTKIVAEGIRVAEEKFSAEKLTIEAQTYVKKLYENLGFVQVSEEFLEDGIPHIRMERVRP